MLACGEAHTIIAARSQSGHVSETWVGAIGSNSEGQSGWGEVESSDGELYPVDGLSGLIVTGLACGASHTLVAVKNGPEGVCGVYTFGSNMSGQLGLGTVSLKESTPQWVKRLQGVSIVLASAGNSHTVVAVHGSSLYSWGSNSVGQLGRSVESTIFGDLDPIPQAVQVPRGLGEPNALSSGREHNLCAFGGS